MVGFQREVTRVVEMHLSVGVVALEHFSARGQEKWIIFAPDSQKGWLLYAEILLELGIGLHIGIAVLRDDGVDALGTSQRESESHWRAVIKHVNREALETD